MKIAVTGSAGKVGRATVSLLQDAGHDVLAFDRATNSTSALTLDTTNFGDVMDALSSVDLRGGLPDAVIHLAAIPRPGLAPDATTFTNNTISTYNVMSACAKLGIPRLVWASSETIHGLPFATPPDFLPVDEEHPDRPEWHYSLSKQLGEQMADAFVRWHRDLSVVSLRISNVYDDNDYAGLATLQKAEKARRLNLWAYVDSADVAQACRLACEATIDGHHRLVVAAADTIMDVPSSELVARHFPDVTLTRPLEGFESLLSSEKAAEVIGYRPAVSWRDRV